MRYLSYCLHRLLVHNQKRGLSVLPALFLIPSLPATAYSRLQGEELDISNELSLFSFVKSTQKPLSLSIPVFGLKHILQWTCTHVPITLTWKFCRIYSQSLKKRNNSYSLPQIAMAWNDSLLLISEKDISSPLYIWAIIVFLQIAVN